ncbi:MAG: helix-turn-helix domain-containing protein [Candidatus Odinarchaeota archaeon]
MANTVSGMIVLGVDQKNEPHWRGVSDIDGWKNKIAEIRRNYLRPDIDLRMFTVDIIGTIYLVIVIPKVEEEIFVHGRYYYRKDASTRYAETSAEITVLQQKKGSLDHGFLVFDKLKNLLTRFRMESQLSDQDSVIRDDNAAFVQQVKELWKAELGIYIEPSLNLFKTVFEKIGSFEEYLVTGEDRLFLARGLVAHSSEIDLTTTGDDVLEPLLLEIFNNLVPDLDLKADLEDLKILLENLNEQKKGFLTRYQSGEERNWALLGKDWPKILETEYDPVDLVYFVLELRKGDSFLASSFSRMIFSHYTKNFPAELVASDKPLAVLGKMAQIQPEIMELVAALPVNRLNTLSIHDIQLLLTRINEEIARIRQEYNEGKQRHEQIPADEERMVKQSFAYELYELLVEHIEWNGLPWNGLAVDDVLVLFNQFNRYLSFPASITGYNWNIYLRERWQEDPEGVLFLCAKKYWFTRYYLESWPEKGKFPELADFLSVGKLGYLNFFLVEVLSVTIIRKDKIYEFIEQSEFTLKNLAPLIENTYYPAIHDFQRIVKEHHPVKLPVFEKALTELKGKNKFINRYHEGLQEVFKDIPGMATIDSKTFMSVPSRQTDQAWYWPFLALLSLFDVVLDILAMVETEKDVPIKNLIVSIEQHPEIWNDLFNHGFYIDSFNDFYPGEKPRNFLKIARTYFLDAEPEIDDLYCFHHLALARFFILLAEHEVYYPLLAPLVEKTRLLQYLFDERYGGAFERKREELFSYRDLIPFIVRRKQLTGEELEEHRFGEILYQTRLLFPDVPLKYLLNKKSSLVKLFWDKIKETGFKTNIYLSGIRQTYTDALIKLATGRRNQLNDWELVSLEVCGHELAENQDVKLVKIIEVLKAIEFSEEREKLISLIPWERYLSEVTDDELSEIFGSGHKSLYMKRGTDKIVAPFVNGLLSTFDRWYEYMARVYQNRLVSLHGVLLTVHHVEESGLKKRLLEKIREKLAVENWEAMIQDNAEDDEPLRNLIDFLDSANELALDEGLNEEILAKLFTGSELFTCYFKSFSEITRIVEWLTEEEHHAENYQKDLLRQFYSLAKGLTLSVKGRYSRPYFHQILSTLSSKTLNQLELQELLDEKRFFQQLTDYFLELGSEENYILDYLQQLFPFLLKAETTGLVDARDFIRTILASVSIEAITMGRDRRFSHRRLFDLKTSTEEEKEFLELLIRDEGFKRLRWAEISEEKHWYEYHEFIRKLNGVPETLTKAILANRSFWDINWLDYIKEWLLGKDKRLLTFTGLLEKYQMEPQVQTFLQSKVLAGLPWKVSCLKIAEKPAGGSSLLSLVEIEGVIEFLIKHNSRMKEISDLLTELKSRLPVEETEK